MTLQLRCARKIEAQSERECPTHGTYTLHERILGVLGRSRNGAGKVLADIGCVQPSFFSEDAFQAQVPAEMELDTALKLKVLEFGM